jgi:F-type H+-transporting ATPase subunit gamma
MSSIKEFQRKIASLKNMRKITGSMMMIASIKLQKTQKVLNASAPFRKSARDFEPCMAYFGKSIKSPIAEGYTQVRKVSILLISGDRGLCGRFNMNTIRKALFTMAEQEKKGCAVTLSCMGVRGMTYLKRRSLPTTFYDGIIAHPDWDKIKKVADDLFEEF